MAGLAPRSSACTAGSLAVLGWETGPVEMLLPNLAGPAERRIPLTLPGGDGWAAVLPADSQAPIAAPDHILLVTARRSTSLALLPGSHGLDPASAVGASAAVELRLERDEALLADPRLLLRTPDPQDLDAALVPNRGGGPWLPDDVSVRALQAEGYWFMRAALPARRVQDLREALDAAFQADVAEHGREALERAGQLGAIRNLSDLGDPFIRLLDDGPAYPLINAVMQPGYVLYAYDGLILGPGEGRFPWDFHTDMAALEGVAFPRRRVPAVNVLHFLDDTTTDNGATWIVPSSHLGVAGQARREDLARLAVQATGSAGDALIFDARLWHCAGCNRTSRRRRLIKTMFSEPWLRPMMDYFRSLSVDKRQGLSPRVRQVLGETAAPPVGTARFRARLAEGQP